MYSDHRMTEQGNARLASQQEKGDRSIYNDKHKTKHKDAETCNINQNERRGAQSDKAKKKDIQQCIEAVNDKSKEGK
jgi:hypothetical protein